MHGLQRIGKWLVNLHWTEITYFLAFPVCTNFMHLTAFFPYQFSWFLIPFPNPYGVYVRKAVENTMDFIQWISVTLEYSVPLLNQLSNGPYATDFFSN